MDRFILGTIKPAQGDVLYLALEDSKRRLQRRMTKLLPTFSGKWPDKLTITTEWRRLHEGGLDDIRAWHEDTEAKGRKPIMVVIDVLAKVRKPTGNKPVYEADYKALTGLHQLSHELGIAIVVIHHTRKMASDDLMETVNGSYGLVGAVDTVIVLANKSGGTVLDVRGRDVEATELAIQFSKDACRWTILGAAADIHQSDQRKKIIAALVENGVPMRISELMATTWMKRNPLELLLGKMVKERSIKRIGVGLYAHKDYNPPPEPHGKSVRSVSPSGQISDRGQPTDGVQKSADICSSVRSVREFTSKPNAPGSVAEHVKSETDQTDGQMKAQATEETEILDFGSLSDLGTDQTDAPADDLTIPEFLLRRDGSLARVCAQCGKLGGTEWKYDGVKVRLHSYCEQSWIESYEAKLSKASQPNNDGHCDGVTVAGTGISKSWSNGVSERRCSYCGRTSGELQETYYGEVSALLHRGCQGAWRAAYDDLDIRNQSFSRPRP
jgi:hypothetical protein